MAISTIKGLHCIVKQNTGFSGRTVHSVILSLGFYLWGTVEEFKELSDTLLNCSNHGADCGFSGFIYYSDTISFYIKHRQDIVSHMEQAAAEFGTDVISMVQGFGVFRNSEKPCTSDIGKALWGSFQKSELTTLYNVFAWYALEEISHAWQRYLEDNPALEKNYRHSFTTPACAGEFKSRSNLCF